MNVDLNKLRKMIRESAPGTTLTVAADVAEALAVSRATEAIEVGGQLRGIEIRISPHLGKGMIMVGGPPIVPPAGGWAGTFLRKSGPGEPGPVTAYDPGVYATPPEPAPTPEPTPWQAKRRQRIVDT